MGVLVILEHIRNKELSFLRPPKVSVKSMMGYRLE